MDRKLKSMEPEHWVGFYIVHLILIHTVFNKDNLQILQYNAKFLLAGEFVYGWNRFLNM